ncbi:hypothetical protein ACGFLT_02220 [Micromonospora chalcea]
MLIEFEAAPERGPFTVAWRWLLRRAVLPYRWVGGTLALLAVFTPVSSPPRWQVGPCSAGSSPRP